MRSIVILAVITAAMLAAAPTFAATLNELYEDATSEAEQGASILDQADWQFRDGNVQQGCAIMERARLHYEKAYGDVSAMRDMVANDSGYSDADRTKVLDWAAQQTATMEDIADRMAETYQAKCQ